MTAVEPLADDVLRVCFADGVWTHEDVKPLVHLPLFQPLRDGNLFQQAHIVCGGYAIAWDADIDISEHELWQRGAES